MLESYERTDVYKTAVLVAEATGAVWAEVDKQISKGVNKIIVISHQS